MNTAKQIIDAIGVDALASALGSKNTSAVYKARSANILPSGWTVIVRSLASEKGIEAPDDVFAYKRPATEGAA